MYTVFVYDTFDPDYCVAAFITDSEEAANFKSNLLEALGLWTSIGYESEDE